jgi:hypothetical protein
MIGLRTGAGAPACLANRGIIPTGIHRGQVTVLADPRTSPQVQARCYTRVLCAISGPDKRCQQGQAESTVHTAASGMRSLIRTLLMPSAVGRMTRIFGW